MEKGLKDSEQGQLHIRLAVVILEKRVGMLVSDCAGPGGTEQLCVTEDRQQLFKDIKG